MGRQKSGVIRGELIMLASVLLYTAIQSFARYLGPSVAPWTKTFYRSSICALLVIIWSLCAKKKIVFRNKPLLLLRGITGALTISFYFWAIDLLDLLHATFYIYSYPVFAVLFSALFYREKFWWPMLFPLVGAIVGLVLIVNPATNEFRFGDLIGFIAAISAGVARATVRELRKTDSPANIVIMFMSMAALFSALWIFFLPSQSWAIVPRGALSLPAICMVLLGMGVLTAFATLFMTTAFRTISTTVGSVLTMLIVPCTVLVAIVIFGETLTVAGGIGGLLIVLSGMSVAVLALSKTE